MISHKKSSKPFCTPQRCSIAGIAVDQITLEDASTQIVEVLRQRLNAAPFLIMGNYNKMVKQHGSDATSHLEAA